MTKSVSAAAALASPTPSLFSDSGALAQRLVEAYLAVRDETERRAAPLSSEDQLIQTMPDARRNQGTSDRTGSDGRAITTTASTSAAGSIADAA